MPKSRKRHHSRSKSRSHSRDRSHEREEKHKKNDSHEKDRDGKRRKIESFDSPSHKRSVSSERETLIDDDPVSTETSAHATEVDLCKRLSGTEDNIEIEEKDGDPPETKTKIHQHEMEVGESVESVTKTEEIINLSNDVSCLQNDENNQDVSNIDNTNQGTDEQKEHPEEKETPNNEKLIDTESVQTVESVIVLEDSDDNIDTYIEGSTLIKEKNKLEITPKKVLSPKQIQKKLESEKKRKEKQLEKEEKEKKRIEEKERLKQEKLQRKKDKEMKEEQKKKEREEKEEQKRKEREEKEQKRKEKEEKEEQKRKEREQEKIKKQLEIEEKNKEKQKEEEKKQKAAAAFVNFFVTKKVSNTQVDRKSESTQPYAFKAFEIKSDMKLPPSRRKPLSEKERDTLVSYIENQDDTASYIKDLKSGKTTGKGYKTWPFEETVDDEVVIVEDDGNLGETICEDKSKLQKLRTKFLKFHENRRPAYFGTWRKKSKCVTPRRPFAEDKEVFNYEEDSDDDWEEEEQGESLNGSDDEADKENEDERDDYEVDNDFFVPHGHLSDDEIDDEENARLSPESLKHKLKLLRDEFEQDMQSKTHKLKPRSIGCIWLNKDRSNVEEPILRYLQPLEMITNGTIQIGQRSEMFTTNTGKRYKPTKKLEPEHIPMFLKVIHGNCNKKIVLVEQFMTYMANRGFNIDIKKGTLIRHLKELASWRKCKQKGPMKNKFCWLVNEDIEKKYNVELSLPNIMENVKK